MQQVHRPRTTPSRATPTASPRRITIFVAAVLALGWPAAATSSPRQPLDGDVLVQNDPVPWIFSPGIDGLVVIAVTGLVAALLVARRSTQRASLTIRKAPA